MNQKAVLWVKWVVNSKVLSCCSQGTTGRYRHLVASRPQTGNATGGIPHPPLTSTGPVYKLGRLAVTKRQARYAATTMDLGVLHVEPALRICRSDADPTPPRRGGRGNTKHLLQISRRSTSIGLDDQGPILLCT